MPIGEICYSAAPPRRPVIWRGNLPGRGGLRRPGRFLRLAAYCALALAPERLRLAGCFRQKGAAARPPGFAFMVAED